MLRIRDLQRSIDLFIMIDLLLDDITILVQRIILDNEIVALLTKGRVVAVFALSEKIKFLLPFGAAVFKFGKFNRGSRRR